MIVVRNVFQLRFGVAKEAVSHMKEGVAILNRLLPSSSTRVLTDLAADFYTVVLENTFESLTDYEERGKSMTGEKDWQEWYAKFIPFVNSGYREIFTVVT